MNAPANPNKVLITGASGFICSHLASQLKFKDYKLRLALRKIESSIETVENISSCTLNLEHEDIKYELLFKDVEIVVHLAGIAHKKSVSDNDYIKINSQGTLHLANEAQKYGVKRFVFISTIKVHGESTSAETDIASFTEEAPLRPQDGYSKSKLEAENALMDICTHGEMEYVILRSPLVFGPGVKANFLKLMDCVSKNYPMPFSGLSNKRSLIYIENLCHVIEAVINSSKCKNQVYLLKGDDISIVDLITEISKAFGRSPKLFYLPPVMLKSLALFFNQKSKLDRIQKSLIIDDNKIKNDLGWISLVDMIDGIQNTVSWYRANH